MEAATPKRTPLFDRHRDAGAKIVPFAGFEMPVRYPAGIREEHLGVRGGAGVFDVSHMGQIESVGPGALELLQRLLSNDVAVIPEGGAQYAVLCAADGGIIDDLITYRLGAERYLTVTNAANHETDYAWFSRHARDYDVEVEDVRADYAMLAVQGPRARDVVQAISDSALPDRMRCARRTLAGRNALVCGTGYTGENGVEILLDGADAEAVWDEVVKRGASPAGLGARDTLRLEACLPLYGNDLSTDRGPIEGNLGWCCKEDTGFVGSDVVRATRAEGPAELLVPFKLTGPGIARSGNPIFGGGVVTSGTLSPCLNVGIGFAYVPAGRAREGEELQVDVRGTLRDAVVASKPLYPPPDQ